MYVVEYNTKENLSSGESFEYIPSGQRLAECDEDEALRRYRMLVSLGKDGAAPHGNDVPCVVRIKDRRKELAFPEPRGLEARKATACVGAAANYYMVSQYVGEEPVGPWAKKVVMS